MLLLRTAAETSVGFLWLFILAHLPSQFSSTFHFFGATGSQLPEDVGVNKRSHCCFYLMTTCPARQTQFQYHHHLDPRWEATNKGAPQKSRSQPISPQAGHIEATPTGMRITGAADGPHRQKGLSELKKRRASYRDRFPIPTDRLIPSGAGRSAWASYRGFSLVMILGRGATERPWLDETWSIKFS